MHKIKKKLQINKDNILKKTFPVKWLSVRSHYKDAPCSCTGMTRMANAYIGLVLYSSDSLKCSIY